MKKYLFYIRGCLLITIFFMSGYVVSLKGVQLETNVSNFNKNFDQQVEIKASFKIKSLSENLSNINDVANFSSLIVANKQNLEKNYELPYLNSNSLTNNEIQKFLQTYGEEQLISELLKLNEFNLIGDLININLSNITKNLTTKNRIDFINAQLQGNESILRHNFQLAKTLFFLYFDTSDLIKIDEIYSILVNFHSKQISQSPLCFEFYRFQIDTDVSLDSLRGIVDDCLSNGKDKKLIYEFIKFVLAEKGIVSAQQEYESYYQQFHKQYSNLVSPQYFFTTL